jgi:hypothetical protein
MYGYFVCDKFWRFRFTRAIWNASPTRCMTAQYPPVGYAGEMSA